MILSTAWAIDWPFHFPSVFAGPWVIAPASDKMYLCLPRSCRLRLNNVIQIIKKVPSIRMLGMSRYWGQNSCIERKRERTCDLLGFSSHLRSSHVYASFVLEALGPPLFTWSRRLPITLQLYALSIRDDYLYLLFGYFYIYILFIIHWIKNLDI